MDFSSFSTGAGLVLSILSIATTIAIYILKRIREGDLEKIRLMKADSDNKIKHLSDQFAQLSISLSDVYTSVQAKLDKQEHQIALARLDKEIDAIRRDNREDFGKIDIKLDRMMDLLIQSQQKKQ